MNRHRMSNNYRVLRNILSKTRQMDIAEDISYLIIYAFLYKYCSDIQKNHFLAVIEDKPITLDEAFGDEDYQKEFRQTAFDAFGFFIPKSELFLDELIAEKYSENFFITDFINAFSKNVEFAPDSSYEEYFKFIFKSIGMGININKFEFEGEGHLLVKDLIYTISKLDIQEREFPFEMVFDRVCDSRIIHMDRDPDYINPIISAIVTSQKTSLDDVYNPFLNDASSLINLAHDCKFAIGHIYAKSSDMKSYCASIVKFLINFFDLDGVFLKYGSPFDSVDVSGVQFDAIVSAIPPMTPRRLKRLNRVQNEEIIKRRNEDKLMNMMVEKFGIEEDAFENDVELKRSVENLAKRMISEKNPADDFTGEYEVLKNSEYLFLINLINSLKDDGMMVVSLSQSFLAKNSLETLRKYLTVEKNCIDCVISLPDVLSRTKRPEVIVVFRKNKSTDDIVFIDLSTDYDTSRSRYSISGTFRRNLVLGRKTIDRIVCVYNRRKTIDRFSNVVDIRELEKNEFNLSISRYVDTFEGDFIRLEDLKNRKEEITSNIKELNKKIDMMMDELGIDF